MAKRYSDKHPCVYCDIEDLKQSGFFGLLDAVASFNPDAGVRFLTHLGWKLKSSFKAAAFGYRKSKLGNECRLQHEARIVSLDSPVDEDGTMFYDLIEDPRGRQGIDEAERRIYNEQLHEALERLLSRINEHYADVVRQIYFYGCRDAKLMKYRERSLNALRKYQNKKELEQFLDYYVVPMRTGLRPTEETAIIRERVEKKLRNGELID